jgi:TonB family protein
MSVHVNRKPILSPLVWMGTPLTGLAVTLIMALSVLSLEACSGGRSLTRVPPAAVQTQPDSFPGTDDSDDPVDVDRLPEMIYYETPVYPRLEQQVGIEGTVWIKSFVLSDGTVSEAKLHESSGNAALDRAALDAGYKCKFEPAIRGDKLVDCWATYKVEFTLPKDAGGN